MPIRFALRHSLLCDYSHAVQLRFEDLSLNYFRILYYLDVANIIFAYKKASKLNKSKVRRT